MLRSNDNLVAEFMAAVKAGNQVLAAQCVAANPSIINTATLNKAIHEAAYADHIVMVRWLISIGADADLVIHNKNNHHASLLQHLVHRDRIEMVQALLPYVKNINYVNGRGMTALHYALNNDNVAMFKLLVTFKPSYLAAGNDAKGKMVDSPIAIIFNECRIEMAKVLFAKYPNAVAECKKTCPNMISYICKNAIVDAASREAMIKYLLTEFPEVLLSNNGGLLEDEHLAAIRNDFATLRFSPELSELLESRIKVNTYFLNLVPKDKTFINKRLNNTINIISSYYHAELLAADLLKILSGTHPVISLDNMKQIFREILFISSPNPALYAQFGRQLFAACNHLLTHGQADSNETKALCQFTLLVLMHTLSRSSLELSNEIATLMSALNPAISLERFTGMSGEGILKEVIKAHLGEVQALLSDLKSFYCQQLNIKLTDFQVNPCSALEIMVRDANLNKLQNDMLVARLQHLSCLNLLTKSNAAVTELTASNALLEMSNEMQQGVIARLNELLARANETNARLAAQNVGLAAQVDEMQDEFAGRQMANFGALKTVENKKHERPEETEGQSASPVLDINRYSFFNSVSAAPAPDSKSVNRRSGRNVKKSRK